MGIIVQIGRNEHVHRSICAFGNIFFEVGLGVDNILAASSVVADVVKGHERVVLAIVWVSQVILDQCCRYLAKKPYLPDVEGGFILTNRVTFAVGKGVVTLHIGLPGDA